MALNFPSGPTNGQTYTYGGITYYYDSSNISWLTTYVAPPSTDFAAANNWANSVGAASNTWANTVSGGYYVGNNGNKGNPSTGPGDIFRVHTNTLTSNIFIDSSNNALAAGPITIAANRTLQINANAVVVIV